jgi:histidinol-phosphate aminotransferase
MSVLVTAEIQSLAPYSAGMPLEQLARERGVVDAVKLASNESALGASPRALEAARTALLEAHRYPDARAFTLRQSLAPRLGVQPDELVFGNGSNELIELLIRTFTTARHHVVFGDPSFVVYRSACLAHGVPHTAVPLRNGVHDLEAMADAVRPATRLVFIANPNNPTGTHVAKEKLQAFLGRVPDDVLVVLDEAYVEFADAPDFADGLSLRTLHPGLVVLRTFSKAYGLAGLRVGYGICPSEVANYLDRVRAPFNVSSMAQAAAIAAWEDLDHLGIVVTMNNRERARLILEFKRLGLSFFPSQANFVLVHFDKDAALLNDRLLDRGIIVRPLPGMPRSLRITVGTPTENDRLLATLAEVLK